MEFVSLTPNAEKLLKEIMDNRLDNGNCDTNYWSERFEGLSFAEDSSLRSTFRELSDAQMIATRWADNVPYVLTVLNNGLYVAITRAKHSVAFVDENTDDSKLDGISRWYGQMQ